MNYGALIFVHNQAVVPVLRSYLFLPHAHPLEKKDNRYDPAALQLYRG